MFETVLASFGQFGYRFRIFFERLKPFLHLKFTIPNSYFIVLDHFMLKNVGRYHYDGNGVSTIETNFRQMLDGIVTVRSW